MLYIGKFKDLTNEKFGKLTVLRQGERVRSPTGVSLITWYCQCDCGNYVTVRGGSLSSGNAKSCGCIHDELLKQRNYSHKQSNTKLYDVWKSMKQRCYNVNNKNYEDYGARGIHICEEWKTDYQTFYDWAITNGYQEGLSIDRIEVNESYKPSNCRWVNQKIQCNNTRTNRHITYNEITHTLAEWSDLYKINEETLSCRLSRGWDMTTALTAPKNYQYNFKGGYNISG